MTVAATDKLGGFPAMKLRVPEPSIVVHRARLVQQLQTAAAAHRVVLIVAPGGSGKTVLAADWARTSADPVAWYALDAADRDSRRLIAGLLAAVDHALPGSASAALAALAQGAADIAVLGVLLGNLEGRRLALVLDDFHRVDEAPNSLALWEHFFRFRPADLSLLILSRTVPLLGFASLVAMDALVGLGQRELSFDGEETEALLSAHGLEAQRAAQLSARSGGWATGILLLARAGNSGILQIRARQETLIEQLGNELLAALPGSMRAFLLESVALGPVTAVETDSILERRDSAACFADVAARGLFLENQDSIYQYHDLFAELLVRVFEEENPARLSELRARATSYWLSQRHYTRALQTLAASRDWPRLASVLADLGPSLWSERLWGTIIEFVELLPREWRSLRLLELSGYAYAEQGNYAKALELADSAAALAIDDEEWLRPALLSVQALVLAGRGEESIRRANAALTVAERANHGRAIARLRQFRGRALLHAGHVDAGRDDLLAALAYNEAQGDPVGQAHVLSQLAGQLSEACRIEEADQLLNRAAALWSRLGNSIASATVHNDRARLHILTGDLTAARAEVTAALAFLEREPHPLTLCECRIRLAEICVAVHALREAEDYAARAVDEALRLDAGEALNAALRQRIDVALAHRDAAGARRLIDSAREYASAPMDSAHLDLREGALALRVRAYTRAVERLDAAAETMQRLNRPHWAARAHLLQAEAHLNLGAVGNAVRALNRAAAVVETYRCAGFMLPYARLCRRVVAERHLLRRLYKPARALLALLADSMPSLSVLPAQTGGDTTHGICSLTVTPFGNGCIVVDNHEIPDRALPARARELLFYAVHNPGPLARSALLEAIWGATEEGASKLWDASRHLRRVLGEKSWTAQRGIYRLEVDMHSHLTTFRRLVEQVAQPEHGLATLAAAEQALTLAGDGAYLEWCDSMWIVPERAAFLKQATAVALAAARIYGELGRGTEEVQMYRRAIAFDQYNERARMGLVQALSRMGMIESALSEYARYQKLLREELNSAPSPRLQRLAARLQAQR